MNRVGDMRRLILIAFRLLILVWLITWMILGAYQGKLPAGVIWAMFSLSAWWLVGQTSKEGKRPG
ncbi:MAG TPA: hypothetical protein VE136_18670 [Anaerolineales bacterium]|nr:hypothetical protein [Anaerolineales bacterium]